MTNVLDLVLLPHIQLLSPLPQVKYAGILYLSEFSYSSSIIARLGYKYIFGSSVGNRNSKAHFISIPCAQLHLSSLVSPLFALFSKKLNNKVCHVKAL